MRTGRSANAGPTRARADIHAWRFASRGASRLRSDLDPAPPRVFASGVRWRSKWNCRYDANGGAVGRHAAVPAHKRSAPPTRRHHHRATRQSLSVAELRSTLAPRQLETAPVGALRVCDLIAQLRSTSSAVRLETDYV